MGSEAEKKRALTALESIYQIAERLYRKDAARFQPIYGWIGAMVKARKDLGLVLRAIERIEQKENDADHVRDVVEYLGGTLRKLEQEAVAKQIRTSGATIGDILSPLLKHHPRKSANPGKTK